MPIRGVEGIKIEQRASLFERIARNLVNAPSFRHLDLEFDSSYFTVAGEVYCYLNAAYKAARLPANSLTKPPKQAAISAIALGVTQPIQPGPAIDRRAITDAGYYHVNSALALRVAASACPFSTLEWPAYNRLRFYRIVKYLSFPSLDNLFEEAGHNNLRITTKYDAVLSTDEIGKIDALVAYIEKLC